MDPFSIIGALAGAGGSIASALIGANAGDNAAAWNYAINLMNLQAQKRQQRELLEYADSVRKDQKLGATDALGNRTYFKEGVGWISELSPEQQALYDYFFKQELPERRAQFQRQAEHSRDNSEQAFNLLDEFKRVRRDTPMEAASKLYLSATRGASDASRDVAEAALRHATRTGNSNIGDIINQIGRASMEQRANARLNADIQAEDYVNQKYATARSGLAQLYQMFLNAASQPLNPSYDPSGIPQSMNSLMNVFSNQAQQGNSMGFNARGQPAPQMDYVQPNYSWANAAGAIGQSLAGLGSRLGGMRQQDQMNDLMRMYITSGGQFDLGGGGLFGRTADRVRAGGGIY